MRETLHPLFQKLPDGISEFTFANLYLFRDTHNYQISRLENQFILTGKDGEASFFMLPFGLPGKNILDRLLDTYDSMKCVSQSQAEQLSEMGYRVAEDRDSFDYLYSREELSELTGKKFHKKRTHLKAFLNNYNYEGRPLLEEHIPDAIRILDSWRGNRDDPGDYKAAKEGLEKSEELQLCGGIYYVDGTPVAYSLGEELSQGKSFAVHFEKAVKEYKGLWQFVNQAFASILPEIYETVNREQDLGNEGLRTAKLSYRPVGFIKKYRVSAV
ncbi:MAG: DUF2156 domain-containing protein [Desulfobulbaceae bacterium]|uniref:DUF2156 domain-containing protein n=1 Tax=Candidatus Desulfobia pelagia TaxID=2841692 RepID=A0A8J6N9R6_9BACT|nr:DUF2156 domain-containing protein [Candidatus Desulfobia pelagia]